MNHVRTHESGAISGSLIAVILLSLALIGTIAFGAWSFMQYTDYKTNFDSKAELAVSEAKKEQAEIDEVKITKEREEPNRQFVGPADYGRVTFDYPKDWSVYEATNVSVGSGTYQAYLNPIVVPPVDNEQKYAIRVIIDDRNIDTVLTEYESEVTDGNLKTSSININGVPGTRIDGNFSKTLRGSAVIFKIRDKTLTIRTDSKTFEEKFNKIVETIKFNQ